MSDVRRLWRIGAALVLLSSGLAIGAPARGGDEEGGPFISAFSTGEAGCTNSPPVGPDDCRSWEESLTAGEASSWDLNREVGLTVSGGAMAAKAVASAVEVDNADGTLGSLTLTATLEATLTGGGNGASRVDFNAGFPVTSETISVIGNASVEGHGTAIIGGSGDISIKIGCEEEAALDRDIQVLGGAHGGEEGRLNDDAKSEPISATITAVPQSNGSRFCSIRISMDAQAGTNRPNEGPEHGSGKAKLSLTILAGSAAPSATPSLGDCALSGRVADGDALVDLHANPLAGIRIELLRNDSVVGSPVATDHDGGYCIPWAEVPQVAPGSPEPGPYEIRATLIDATHEPPIFHTEHQSLQEPISARYDVEDDEWGRPGVKLAFTATDAQPWLSDVAVIHWESARFVEWLVDVLVVDPASIAGFRVRAYDNGGTRYTPSDKAVHISAVDSPYLQRIISPQSNPENGEWHEIVHHLDEMVGIAPLTTAACQGRVNHGGWTNTSTCDSLSEGFAMFVPTLASLELDAGRDNGYATPHYAGFGSLDDNIFSPWSFRVFSDGEKVYREDFAVARLMWDLYDDTPTETKTTIALPLGGGGVLNLTLHDRVALGGTALIRMMMQRRPETIADIHDFLTTSPLVDAALRTPDVDLDGDGTADVSAIDEVFLLHDFRPLLTTGAYEIGSEVGHTPPGKAGFPDRRHIEALPGSVVRLVNTGTGRATFTIEVTSESGTGTFAAPVAPGQTLDIAIELGPYWTAPLADDAGLPACGAEGERLTTLAVSGPGGVRQSLDSCDYAHRTLAAAAGGAALTVTAAGTEPVPSGAPGALPGAGSGGVPIVLIVGLVAIAVVIGVVAVVLVRRRA